MELEPYPNRYRYTLTDPRVWDSIDQITTNIHTADTYRAVIRNGWCIF